VTTPSESTVKKLFALSRNLCAFTRCSTHIVDPLSGALTGQICHIKARSLKGPRYDEKQTDEARCAFANLIVLCRNHHGIVDDRPATFTVELLNDMKEMHERNGNIELSQEDARLARLLLAGYSQENHVNIGPRITQTVVGNHNINVAGDHNIYHHPPKVKVTLARKENSVTPAQCRKIQKWIETLVENTTRMTREQAYKMWWGKFKGRFELNKYEELDAALFEQAKVWYQQQKAILTRGLKMKAPDAWRNARYAAIKRAMNALGTTNGEYYPKIARRLKMRKGFLSLTELTKRDLDRVYAMVSKDARMT
jgi:hypothetical protein